jgi:hypothetical protein
VLNELISVQKYWASRFPCYDWDWDVFTPGHKYYVLKCYILSLSLSLPQSS